MSERGWVTVENAIEVWRSPEDVFDYMTDITKEAEWNPRTRRAEKLTPGPIGLGTQFSAEWIKGNPAIVEYIGFERPMAWASVARSRRLDARVRGGSHRRSRAPGSWSEPNSGPRGCSPCCCR
jgi:hypothetical protein